MERLAEGVAGGNGNRASGASKKRTGKSEKFAVHPRCWRRVGELRGHSRSFRGRNEGEGARERPRSEKGGQQGGIGGGREACGGDGMGLLQTGGATTDGHPHVWSGQDSVVEHDGQIAAASGVFVQGSAGGKVGGQFGKRTVDGLVEGVIIAPDIPKDTDERTVPSSSTFRETYHGR